MEERDPQREGAPDPGQGREGYEPPALEDLTSTDGPSMTAAGRPTGNPAAPRQL